MRHSLSIAMSLLTAALFGCNDAGGGATCTDYQPPATFDAQTPKVSLSKDVMPIFTGSCGFTSCHSLADTKTAVFLGADAPKVHQSLVGIPSRALTTMTLVAPNDPQASFLMRKVDASQCVFDAQCVDGTCGVPMPRGEELLPLRDRDTIRRWIAQGAKND